MAYKKDPGKEFIRNEILELKDMKYSWVGIEQWTVKEADGSSRTSKPTLVKREKVKNPDESGFRTGKCKGFTIDDFNLILEKQEEIKGALSPDDEGGSGS